MQNKQIQTGSLSKNMQRACQKTKDMMFWSRRIFGRIDFSRLLPLSITAAVPFRICQRAIFCVLLVQKNLRLLIGMKWSSTESTMLDRVFQTGVTRTSLGQRRSIIWKTFKRPLLALLLMLLLWVRLMLDLKGHNLNLSTTSKKFKIISWVYSCAINCPAV